MPLDAMVAPVLRGRGGCGRWDKGVRGGEGEGGSERKEGRGAGRGGRGGGR
jgi:hypothetical protein